MMVVTSVKLSQRLKEAGAAQEGQLDYAIGPEEMPEEQREKVSGFTLEYLFKKMPMSMTLGGKKMAFDFCRFQVDSELIFAVSYRPVNSTLAMRKDLIPGGAQDSSFTEAMGELYYWLLTATTVFGEPKKAKVIDGPGAGEQEPVKKEQPTFVEVPVEETPAAEEPAEPMKTTEAGNPGDGAGV